MHFYIGVATGFKFFPGETNPNSSFLKVLFLPFFLPPFYSFTFFFFFFLVSFILTSLFCSYLFLFILFSFSLALEPQNSSHRVGECCELPQRAQSQPKIKFHALAYGGN